MPDRASRTKVVGLIAWWKVFPARVRIGTGQVAAGLLGTDKGQTRAVNTLVYLLQNQMLQMAFSLSPYDMQITFDEKLNNFL